MSESSLYIYAVMEIFQQKANYIPQQLDKNRIALQCFINSSKPIKSMLIFSNTDNGRSLPALSECLQIVSVVDEGIPKDRALSLSLACVTLGAEYQNHHIEFQAVELPNELQLASSFKCILDPTSQTYEILGVLDSHFNTIREIQGRMSKGVLIR